MDSFYIRNYCFNQLCVKTHLYDKPNIFPIIQYLPNSLDHPKAIKQSHRKSKLLGLLRLYVLLHFLTMLFSQRLISKPIFIFLQNFSQNEYLFYAFNASAFPPFCSGITMILLHYFFLIRWLILLKPMI
ncbi:uncharacterized protein BYT42DRAFT_570022 [Radiomyces spectabilis]|uniref:uncharacterized protein n=1 Tax=Radiomyces spectabilis TaxID=64574 RepID=UPI00221FC433|nr:uncharacterized protein BYT42DRAFT_570022 [Radiomyces spectabilis]KAI8379789.1 hypothetical protein BYT42DRAFT_570022 [Radiomyces spectabilis]